MAEVEREFIEDEAPDDGDIIELVRPQSTRIYRQGRRFNLAKHRAGTQKFLAIALVVINASAIAVLLYAVLTRLLTVEEALQLSPVLGSLQGLAGAAIGFFFATEHRKADDS